MHEGVGERASQLRADPWVPGVLVRPPSSHRTHPGIELACKPHAPPTSSPYTLHLRAALCHILAFTHYSPCFIEAACRECQNMAEIVGVSLQ